MKIKILVTLLFFLVPFVNVEASSATISVSNSRSTVIVGNSFQTTVTVSSSENLGAWEFELRYDNNRLNFSGSSFDNRTHIVDTVTSSGQKSATYTFDFVANATGTANVYIANATVYDFDENNLSVTEGSRSVSIISQQQYQDSLSSNNDLKSLGITDFELESAFDKDNLEYFVSLPPETTEIEIYGEKDHASASVSGLGTKEVAEGENKFEVVVTAQNGSKKTYIINAIVEELEPVIIKINGEEHTVIRNIDQFECPTYFLVDTIKYEEEEIPGCYNEALKITLIAVRGDEGQVKYFVYENNEFKAYREIVFSRLVFYSMAFPNDIEIPDGYVKVTLKINGVDVEGYRNENNPDFNLIYGMNMASGDEGLYQYDKEEGTMQRFVYEEPEEAHPFPIFTMSLIVLALVLFSAVIFLHYQFQKAKDLIEKLKFKLEKTKKQNDDEYIAKS